MTRLDWWEHINARGKKLTSVLYAINKVNHILPVASLNTHDVHTHDTRQFTSDQ